MCLGQSASFVLHAPKPVMVHSYWNAKKETKKYNSDVLLVCKVNGEFIMGPHASKYNPCA